MGLEWRVSTWGDEVSLEYGKVLRGYQEDKRGYRVFGSNGPIGWAEKPLVGGPGVILGRKGAYRGVHFSKDPFFVIDTAYYVVPKSEMDRRWLYYAIQYHKLGEIDDGSPIPSTTRAAVYVRELEVPSVPEQRKIGRVLESLDDRIDYNRALAANLEAIARRLFKSWFVDFDPIRAKAAGEKPAGLADDIAALFPDRFEDSELGEIPEGWEMRTIGELADVVGGSTPSTKNDNYWVDGQHCWATPKDLARLSSPVLLNTERKVTDSGLSKISSGLLPTGTVLLSSRAPIGYLAIAAMPVAINQGFIAMKPKPNVSNLYLLFWAESSHEIIVANANGSTFLEINKKNFRPIPAIDPGSAVVTTFANIVSPLFNMIVCAEREIALLTQLRDLLLPRLVSGKLRVEDAEPIIEVTLA